MLSWVCWLLLSHGEGFQKPPFLLGVDPPYKAEFIIRKEEKMMIKREVSRAYTAAEEQGFLGEDHKARALIQVPFPESDPFILLMDDVLDKKDNGPVGGPHPHAGFETVSLLLNGEIGDQRHKMKAGDLQLMTAGRGIVHSEVIEKKSTMRLLQLWLNLPKKDRWASPKVQDIAYERVPLVASEGVEIRVYSGSLEGTTSPVINHTPLILAVIHLEAHAEKTLQLPASYSAFLYMLEGTVKVGETQTVLRQHQVGWLDRLQEEGESELLLEAGEAAARLVLYAGQ